jgi:hypothetical protein
LWHLQQDGGAKAHFRNMGGLDPEIEKIQSQLQTLAEFIQAARRGGKNKDDEYVVFGSKGLGDRSCPLWTWLC